MHRPTYLMESDEEALRLDMKTDPEVVENRARWAGIARGMRVADLGCGSGKTTYHLNRLVQPDGETIGVDYSQQRLDFAEAKYRDKGLTFLRRDIRDPLDDLGQFDLVWMRFVLEYYREESFDIVKHVSGILKPGGILCLIDVDCNFTIHYGLSPELEKMLVKGMDWLGERGNFDPYAGRRLYAYLYDLGYQDIVVDLQCRGIYGTLSEKDEFNVTKKMALVPRLPESIFEGFAGGRSGLLKELDSYVHDPRRFMYNTQVCCRGVRPI
jgi:ubiquinone/menaquinone biosynthesis C-methylase UbiE